MSMNLTLETDYMKQHLSMICNMKFRIYLSYYHIFNSSVADNFVDFEYSLFFNS